jgi:hypothetical protein
MPDSRKRGDGTGRASALLALHIASSNQGLFVAFNCVDRPPFARFLAIDQQGGESQYVDSELSLLSPPQSVQQRRFEQGYRALSALLEFPYLIANC